MKCAVVRCGLYSLIPAPMAGALRIGGSLSVVVRQPLPSAPLQNRCNSTLVRGADPPRFKIESAYGDFADGHIGSTAKPIRYALFPDVSLKPGLLLGPDVIALESFVGPPSDALPIKVYSLGE